MTMKLLIIPFCAALILTACSAENSDTCINHVLEAHGMHPYTGEIEGDGCRTYLHHFIIDDEFYFQLDNPCADMILHLIDCDLVNICLTDSDLCMSLLAKAEYQGIIGRS